MELTNRVKAGIAFLDSIYGATWKDKINLDTVRLNDACQCILGQTDSKQDYTHHIHKLGITYEAAFNLGFNANNPDISPEPASQAAWNALTMAWKHELRAIGIR